MGDTPKKILWGGTAGELAREIGIACRSGLMLPVGLMIMIRGHTRAEIFGSLADRLVQEHPTRGLIMPYDPGCGCCAGNAFWESDIIDWYYVPGYPDGHGAW